MAIDLAAAAAVPVEDTVDILIIATPLGPWPLGVPSAAVAARASAAIAPSAPLAIASTIARTAAAASRTTALPSTSAAAAPSAAQEVDEGIDIHRPRHRRRARVAAGPPLR